ncbi:expressed protein [Phakopsora pachyrhizi]|uniref:Expressed protein n=1 Tax=Phakopsora pachyrhizi TaxID=170000 RepID=A0AAV0BHS6_PHAPC|nr:expressed protein [Phakopsora pachyrhizi]
MERASEFVKGYKILTNVINLMSCINSKFFFSFIQILEEHAKEYGFTSVILRIAQLCGSRKNGAWNKSEWFPLLVQSGIQLGCLPDGADNIAWIPVDEAAKALNDISFYERVESDLDRKNTYRHLVHPKPVLWHNIIETLGEMISSVRSEKYGNRSPVKLVSYQEWFENLMKKSEEVQLGSSLGEIGALKLIDHFKAQLKSGGLHLESIKGFEAMGVRRLVTSKSEVESSHLTNCLPLNDSDANLWFKYWQANGLF